MDNGGGNFLQVQTAPQVVTISLDPVLHGTLADLSLKIGTLIGETVAMRQMMERLTAQLVAESVTRQEWDSAQIAIAKSIGVDTPSFAAPVTNAAAEVGDGPPSPVAPATGALDSPTGASTGAVAFAQSAAPAAFRAPDADTLRETYLAIENDWFDNEGQFFIRGAAGEPDRRATPLERQAIETDIAKGGRRGRRR